MIIDVAHYQDGRRRDEDAARVPCHSRLSQAGIMGLDPHIRRVGVCI